jgi:hypothetical protein
VAQALPVAVCWWRCCHSIAGSRRTFAGGGSVSAAVVRDANAPAQARSRSQTPPQHALYRRWHWSRGMQIVITE